MDSGEGYHGDVEYKVGIKKHLSGDIVLSVEGVETNSIMTLPPDGNISLGIERLGIIMRRDFEVFHKDKFLEWVKAKEPMNL